jgi:hypothetical protein
MKWNSPDAGRMSAMAAQIALVEDGPGSYRFTFASARGELSGRVTVGIEGPPDRRSEADREQAAKNQILALSREFAEACGD